MSVTAAPFIRWIIVPYLPLIGSRTFAITAIEQAPTEHEYRQRNRKRNEQHNDAEGRSKELA
jgi:hypothetical protein